MGAEQSQTHKQDGKQKAHNEAVRRQLRDAFKKAVRDSDSEYITEKYLTDSMGQVLGRSIYNYWTRRVAEAGETCEPGVSQDQYVTCAAELLTDASVYFHLFDSVGDLLGVCHTSSGVWIETVDDDPDTSKPNPDVATAQALLLSWKYGNDASAWVVNNCPRLLDDLRAFVNSRLLGRPYEAPTPRASSELLTVFQFWLCERIVPQPYLDACRLDANTSGCWTLLYNSSVHGLSVNRFEHQVFSYNAPTTTLIQLCTGQVYILALDTSWREGAAQLGSTDVCCVRLLPEFTRYDHPDCKVSLNLKGRGASGLLVTVNNGSVFLSVDSTFSNVFVLETWGCGPPSALSAQQQHKKWQSKQAEKLQKVPLPGNWDDNPDKFLLGMAGAGVFAHEDMTRERITRNTENEKQNL